MLRQQLLSNRKIFYRNLASSVLLGFNQLAIASAYVIHQSAFEVFHNVQAYVKLTFLFNKTANIAKLYPGRCLIPAILLPIARLYLALTLFADVLTLPPLLVWELAALRL